MAINLNGLRKTHDAKIFVNQGGITVTTRISDLIHDLEMLPVECGYELLSGTFHRLNPEPHYDGLELAERIALDWEEQGYKVLRQHLPLIATQASEVQSFLLV